MISTAGVANRDDGGTGEIFEGSKPGFEDRPHHVVALQINPAYLSGTVVDVEVAGELGVLRRELHGFGVAEVLFDISLRAEQALLFPAPQAHANGAVHL